MGLLHKGIAEHAAAQVWYLGHIARSFPFETGGRLFTTAIHAAFRSDQPAFDADTQKPAVIGDMRQHSQEQAGKYSLLFVVHQFC